MKPWRSILRVSSVALAKEGMLRRASRTDFGDAGGRRLSAAGRVFTPSKYEKTPRLAPLRALC